MNALFKTFFAIVFLGVFYNAIITNSQIPLTKQERGVMEQEYFKDSINQTTSYEDFSTSYQSKIGNIK